MTIALGILCGDGVVVGADREYSLTSLKVDGPKAHIVKRGPCALGIVGSGTADLVTFVVQELQRRLPESESAAIDYEGVREITQDVCEHVFKTYIEPDQGRRGIDVDVIIGIKVGSQTPRLLKIGAGLPAIWGESFETIGYGGELAHYLLDQWYDKGQKPNVRRGIILMAHVLKAAKDYVQFCGGETDIIYLKPGLVTSFVHEDDVLLHEGIAGQFANIVKPVMSALTDVSVSGDQLNGLIDTMTVRLNSVRPNSFTERQVAKTASASPVVSIHGDEFSSGVTSVYGTDAPSPSAPFDDGSDEHE